MLAATAVLAVPVGPESASGAAGDLDPGFGAGGIALHDAGGAGQGDVGSAVAIQQDGRIVVAGAAYVGSYYQASLTRFLPDGQVDTGFGTAGTTLTSVGAQTDQAMAVALEPDGGILVAGYTVDFPYESFLLLRFAADGTLDPSFGASGVVVTDLGFNGQQSMAMARQPDGRIVVAGHAVVDIGELGLANDLFLLRHDADGTLDPTFGTSGVVQAPVGEDDDRMGDVTLQTDGAIVVVGGSRDAAGAYHFAMRRFAADGSIDVGFGGGEQWAPATCPLGSHGNAALVQPDGGIVVAAGCETTGGVGVALARLESDGDLDESFGDLGVATLNWAGTYNAPTSVALQGDGKILVVGHAFNGANYDIGVARLTSAGQLDGSFGDGGKTTIPVRRHDFGRALALRASGAAIITGSSSPPGGFDDTVLVGLEGDPCGSGLDVDGARLSLKRLEAPSGDERLELRGSLTLGALDPPLDPAVAGLRVVVDDASHSNLADLVVPGGAYDPLTRIGWRMSSPTRWRYDDRDGANGPVRSASVALSTAAATLGRVTVLVKATGSFPAPGSPLPLTAAVVLDPPASTDRCAIATFPGPPPAPSCIAATSGKTITCR